MSDHRRCRAAVTPAWSWRASQCSYRAKAERALAPERRELPVCGIHLRASAWEYRPSPGDPFDAAVEAVVR